MKDGAEPPHLENLTNLAENKFVCENWGLEVIFLKNQPTLQITSFGLVIKSIMNNLPVGSLNI
jgi:hypothetical protein